MGGAGLRLWLPSCGGQWECELPNCGQVGAGGGRLQGQELRGRWKLHDVAGGASAKSQTLDIFTILGQVRAIGH